MTPERAIEILDPTHREHYESIEPINEAMRMGQAAIERCMVAKKPIDRGHSFKQFPGCPTCGETVLFKKGKYCRYCGQLIDWGGRNENAV